MKLYATVGDVVQFITHPKGSETHKGEKGNWKTIEGPQVVGGITVTNPAEFAAKSEAIGCLWPGAVIRFMLEKDI